MIVLARTHAPTPALVAAAFAGGAAFPPTSSVLRAQYPRLFGHRPGLMQGAFALDSVLTESIFTAGPLLTALVVVAFEPAAALVGLGRRADARHHRARVRPAAGRCPVEDAARTRFGALAVPGIRTLVASMLPVGFAFGALEVALPAFATTRGGPSWPACSSPCGRSAASTGGLTYGARPRRGTLASVHLRVAVLLPSQLPPARARGLARRRWRCWCCPPGC